VHNVLWSFFEIINEEDTTYTYFQQESVPTHIQCKLYGLCLMTEALVPWPSYISDLNVYREFTETSDTFWRPCKLKYGMLIKKL
jgi:hypothetical protein